ncbi:MAG TPA: dTMP kinase [Verrucomicrobiae bacterium]|nr:dTMP kinase [Verrucomicrobiae bacterium]
MFITFEGIEGCGKTTQLRLLAGKLRQEGRRVLTTREPGGTPVADSIRAILLDAANTSLVPLAELLLYAASRAQHVAEVIRPALQEGSVVLCDRFTDATVAYQGHGRGLDLQLISSLNHTASCGLVPDLTVLIDCPVETGLRRAFARIAATAGDREERFEQESVDFHRRVREGYLELAHLDPARFLVVPGGGSVEETATAVEAAVAPRVGLS